MEFVGDVVKQVIGKWAQKEFDSVGKIDRLWCNILEKNEVEHTALRGIKNGTLFVSVDSPLWHHQMRIKKRKYLDKIKEELPEIINISFQIGKVK